MLTISGLSKYNSAFHQVCSTLLYFLKYIKFFSSCVGKIKAFRWSLEAVDYAFAHTNYRLQKTIFQNTQKMMVQKVISLQSW